MRSLSQSKRRLKLGCPQRAAAFLYCTATLLWPLMSGCAALSNAGVQALPVRRLPPELRGNSQEGLQPIPMALLGQPRPDAYRIGRVLPKGEKPVRLA